MRGLVNVTRQVAPAADPAKTALLRALYVASGGQNHPLGKDGMPYLAPAIGLLRARACPQISTIAVSESGLLLYSPEFVAKCGDGKPDTQTYALVFAVLHETLHLVLDHATRRRAHGVPEESAALRRWNIAADLEINSMLEAVSSLKGAWKHTNIQVCLPASFQLPEHQTAEWYYERLPANAGGGGEGTPAMAAGQCGSGSGGERVPGEDDPTADERATVQAQIEAARSQIESIVQELERAKAAGSIPGSFRSWVDARGVPARVPWERVLRRRLTNTLDRTGGYDDYAYDRPSRRQSAVGYGPRAPVLPRSISPRAHVVVAIDSSGSMGDDELAQCVAETVSLAERTGAQVTVLVCDTQIHQVQRYEGPAQLRRSGLAGRGGTDFRPIFEWAEACRVPVSSLVIMTDGFGPAPVSSKLASRTTWLLVGGETQAPVPWGTVIEVPRHDR